MTRLLFLTTGAELFLKAARARPFADLTVLSIAEEADRSAGSFYDHWDTREDYFEDLARHLLEDEEIFTDDFERIRMKAISTEGLGGFEAICEVATTDVETLENNAVWEAMELLLIGYTRFDPALVDRAQRGYRATDTSAFELYDIVLSRLARTPRAPFTRETIGLVLQALVEGAGIRQLVDPEVFKSPLSTRGAQGSPDYGAYATAVAALLAVLTVPIEDKEKQDVTTVIERLLGESPPAS